MASLQGNTPQPPSQRLNAFKIAGFYALFGLAWILFSDQLLLLLTRDAETLAQIQTVKGWLFIAVTATMLFFLVQRALKNQAGYQATLHRSEQRFRTLLDTLPDLIWLKDANGIYLSCNATFERFFGASEAEIVGKTDYDFVDRELADFFREHDRKAMAAGKPCSNEEWITFADNGERVLLLTTKTVMYDADGSILGVLGIGRDITEIRMGQEKRIQLEKQLHQAQKMESIGQLAGGVAHDFNNMLGVIIGQAELALIKADRTEDPQNLSQNLREIRKAAKHSADLTRQLLTFARKQAIAPRILDLNTTVSGMLSMLQRLIGENIRLVWEPGKNLWPVHIDPTQVDQILANLCVNSRDAISGNGTVTIRTANLAGSSVIRTENTAEERNGHTPTDFVMLSVEDDGAGMDQEQQKRIFEPFFTTKEPGAGTGLGLATVYGAVRQNGGQIEFSTSPGRGTCFTIYFPRAAEDLTDREESRQQQFFSGTETILLVEDEEPLLDMKCSVLRECGYSILAASSAEKALRIASQHPGRIDLLITDVIMPEMNGKDLAAKIEKLHKDIRILYISGYSKDIISPHGVVDPDVHFLQKPVSFSTLSEKVRTILDTQ